MSNRKKITLAILIFLTVILAGVSIYVTVRLQDSQAPSTTDAASGYYRNICGSSNASWNGRSSQCVGCQPGSCSGNYVYKFYCNGNHNECGGGGATPTRQEGPSNSYSLGNEACGQTIQIDTFTGPNYTGLKDFFVYYTGDCTQPTAKYRCSNNSCIRDDAGGTYTSSSCNNACNPAPTCPSSVQARFRLTVNGTDIGLRSSGSFKKSEVSAIDYTVVTNMQTNPPSYFNGTVTVTGPNGFTATNNGVASPRPISNIQAGTYTLSAVVNGSKCDGATITITDPVVQTACYRCTVGTADGNACENQTVNGSTCPTGWTTNSNCATVATGGACPVDIPKIQCYRCTAGVFDGNACENQQFDGTSCPSGWTTNSNCATGATGGACPVETRTASATAACVGNTNQITINWNSVTGDEKKYTVDISETNSFSGAVYNKQANNVNTTTAPTGFNLMSGTGALTLDPAKTYYVRVAYTSASGVHSNVVPVTTLTCTEPTIQCYRCTSGTTDGNLCENQQFNGTSCPTGWTTNSACATDAPGGACPVEVACGASCNGNSALCPQGHTCDANVCKLNTCLTPGNCSDNTCTPTVPVCGSSCTTNAQCPNNHSCTGNKCVLNGCTGSTCTNGCVPLCGGPCTANNECPNNHSCSAGKCVLNGCTGSTCTNGCSVIPIIPQTGIIDDARLLIIGTLFIMGGYISIRFGLGSKTNFLTNMYENMTTSYEDKAERKLKKKAEK